MQYLSSEEIVQKLTEAQEIVTEIINSRPQGVFNSLDEQLFKGLQILQNELNHYKQTGDKVNAISDLVQLDQKVTKVIDFISSTQQLKKSTSNATSAETHGAIQTTLYYRQKRERGNNWRVESGEKLSRVSTILMDLQQNMAQPEKSSQQRPRVSS